MSSPGLLRLCSIWRHHFSTYKCNKYVCIPNNYGQYTAVLRNSNIVRDVSKTELNNNKNIEKDKLLFFNENPRFYRMLNIFAFVQLLFWVNMAEFTYSKMKDLKVPEKKDLPWWQRISFQDTPTKMVVSGICLLLGYCTLSIAWMFSTRSVRMLVLRKDNKTLSIVTYGPFGGSRFLEIPLEKVTTNQTRATAKQQLPLKVQGKWFYYIMDVKNGTFKNPELFDYTAGLKRTLKN